MTESYHVSPARSVTSSYTAVTVHEALCCPSAVVAVMVAVPAPVSVTTPSATVATASSELAHVTVRSAAFAGVTVAVSVTGSFSASFSDAAESVTPVAATGVAVGSTNAFASTGQGVVSIA